MNQKLLLIIGLFAFVGAFTSCDKENKDACDDVVCSENETCVDGTCVRLANENVIDVTANVTTDVTWKTGKCYVLTKRIAVEDGSTLTIEPGVIIKGEAGSGANATALVVARGGKVIAEGTVTQPIIFTSVADKIEPGMIESPNLDTDIDGLWGGLIILGRAPISADASAVQIEGIPPSDQNGLYGGSDVADNSGVYKYISVRHGGANIGEGNEINGITFGGVGNGTVVENIEVIANQDDGIECFGGSVNIKNAIVWGAGDDQFDMDQAYTGTIDNFIAVLGENSDHGFELDGPEGTLQGSFTLKNGSLRGNLDTENGEYIDLRDNVTCTLENIYFTNFKGSSDVELDNEGVSDKWAAGEIIFKNIEFNVSHLTEGNLTLDAIFADKSETNNRDAELNEAAKGFAKIVTTKSTGANADVFSGWTVTSLNIQLSGL